MLGSTAIHSAVRMSRSSEEEIHKNGVVYNSCEGLQWGTVQMVVRGTSPHTLRLPDLLMLTARLGQAEPAIRPEQLEGRKMLTFPMSSSPPLH
jgi:hypothetical protein